MKTFNNIKSIIAIIALVLCVSVCFVSCDVINSFIGHDCADEDGNHICDNCEEVVSECADNNKDHKCDVCAKTLTKCVNADDDHDCDICGAKLTECLDETNDHKCDICDDELTSCADDNNDHDCDICGDELTVCVDDDDDHNCDICGDELSVCVDETNDHKCDVCNATLTQCENTNPTEDHNCDVCGTKIDSCAEGEVQDHNCDVCNEKISDCEDATNDHNCDVCGATLTQCANANATEDHKCDTCGKVVDPCVDADTNEYCDICDKFLFKLATFDNGIENEHVNGYIFIDGEFKNAKDVDASAMNAATPTRFLYNLNALKMRVSPTIKETEKEGYFTIDLSNNKQEGNYYTFVTRINHDAGTTGNDIARISFVDANGNAAYSFIVTTATGAKMRLYSDSGVEGALDVTTDVSRGSWFDLAAEVCTDGENATIKLYVNGALAYEGQVAGAAGTTIGQIRVDTVVPGSGKAGSIHFDNIAFARTSEKVYE